MKVSQYGKKLDRKILRFMCSVIGLGILVAVLIFVLYFQVRTVEVTGNHYLTEEEVKNLVLQGPFQSNTYLLSRMDYSKRTEGIPFLKKITVEQKGHDSICIHVTEKQLEGYVRYLDGYLYFDQNGVVQESTTEPLEGIPYIEGLSFDHVRLGDKLPVGDDEVFKSIVGVTRMIAKNSLSPDRIVIDEAYNFTMYFGDVVVQLGKDSEMEEKVTHLTAILPKLEGMKGVLHLEGVNPQTKNITFEKDVPPQEEETLEEESVETPEEEQADAESGQENKDTTEQDVSEEDAKEAAREQLGLVRDSESGNGQEE